MHTRHVRDVDGKRFLVRSRMIALFVFTVFGTSNIFNMTFATEFLSLNISCLEVGVTFTCRCNDAGQRGLRKQKCRWVGGAKPQAKRLLFYRKTACDVITFKLHYELKFSLKYGNKQ